MDILGKIISKARKERGFTQEELAELSKVNLRTIQRIENNKSEPRGKTLNLISEALKINVDELLPKDEKLLSESIGAIIINGFFLILLNLCIITIIGYMTLPNEANLNSRTGAVLLSFFMPFFIVYFTKKMSRIERILKFGSGFMFYIVFSFIVVGIKDGFQNGLSTRIYFCIIIFIAVLYYGNIMLKKE